MSAKPKRRWFQFSLMALLVLITVLCVPLAWLAYERNEVRKREADISAIQGFGYVGFDEAEPFRPIFLRPLLDDKSPGEVKVVCIRWAEVTNADLTHVTGLTKLEVLILADHQNCTNVTDAGLVHLARLKELKQLELNGYQLTDAGIAHLVDLSSLETLFLNDTQVTDAGLAHIASLTNLRALFLNGTQVTDSGLPCLASLSKLEQLSLKRTKVTDAGLTSLAGLKKLDTLFLQETQVTQQGRRELKKGLPKIWFGTE